MNGRSRDVAAAGVIDNRTHTHNYARLYFRPRTPTQWHIEGIRKPGECNYGDAAHAPILVMMIFDAKSVLTREGVHFCDRNTQLGAAVIGSSQAYFDAIPFDKVFHEGATGDRTIFDHRCAEVLAMSPMPLNDTLQWVYCRTEAERATLLHMLGSDAERWKSRVLISDDLLVFERKYAFVEDVAIDGKGLVVKFSPRQDRQPIDVQVRVLNKVGREVISFRNNSMPARPNPPSVKWRFKGKLSGGVYLAEVRLEGQLAFRASLPVRSDVLV